MHKSIFTMDVLGGAGFEGWTDGSDWNGWATPWFEFTEAMRLVDFYNKLDWEPEKKVWFDSEKGQFCFILADETDAQCYGPDFVVVEGKETKLYPIGTRVWIWEEQAEKN